MAPRIQAELVDGISAGDYIFRLAEVLEATSRLTILS